MPDSVLHSTCTEFLLFGEVSDDNRSYSTDSVCINLIETLSSAIMIQESKSTRRLVLCFHGFYFSHSAMMPHESHKACYFPASLLRPQCHTRHLSYLPLRPIFHLKTWQTRSLTIQLRPCSTMPTCLASSARIFGISSKRPAVL